MRDNAAKDLFKQPDSPSLSLYRSLSLPFSAQHESNIIFSSNTILFIVPSKF